MKYSRTSLISDTYGTGKSSEVGVKSLARNFLGEEKMSLLERCPHFRGVLMGSAVYLVDDVIAMLLYLLDDVIVMLLYLSRSGR